MQRRVGVFALATVCVVSTAGCLASLSLSEERQWGRMLDKQIVREPILFKSKGVGGFWSVVIPGTGHFYAGHPGLGVMYVLGNLLWPINIFWTLPAGLQAIDVTNKQRTVEYYTLGAHAARVEQLKSNGKLPADFKTKEDAAPLLTQ